MKKEEIKYRILDSQMEIYDITRKYDPTTNFENYQELSLFWLSHMTSVDKLLVKHHAKRTLRLTKKLNKKNKANKIEAPVDYEK